MLRRAHQFHLACFSWAGKYTKSTANTRFSVGICPLLIKFRGILHTDGIDRASIIGANTAGSALFWIIFNYEAAFGIWNLAQQWLCVRAPDKQPTAVVTARAYRRRHTV